MTAESSWKPTLRMPSTQSVEHESVAFSGHLQSCQPNVFRLQSSRIITATSPVILSSKEGDPLGPMLFQLPSSRHCLNFKMTTGFVVFVVGPTNNFLSDFEDLKLAFRRIGLDLQEQKCEIYNPIPSETC